MTRRTSKLRRRRASKKASRITSTGLRVLTKLHTMDETAELLCVSKRTVQRLIDSGALQAHYLGRAVRISDADIAAFLAENCSA